MSDDGAASPPPAAPADDVWTVLAASPARAAAWRAVEEAVLEPGESVLGDVKVARERTGENAAFHDTDRRLHPSPTVHSDTATHHADALAAAAVHATPLLATSSSACRAARAAVRAAVRASPAAARALAAAVLKARPKAGKTLPPGDARLLAMWAAAALTALPPDDAAKAAPRLAEVAAAAAVSGGAAAAAPTAAALRAVPAAFDAYAAAAAKCPPLARAIASAAQGDAARAAVGGALTSALAARDGADTVAALAPYVATLSGDDIVAGPLAAALQACKRSAEAGLTATAALLAGVSPTADLAPAAASVVEAAVPSLRGAGTPAAAAAALDAVRAVGVRCASAPGAAAAADALLSALGVNGTKPRAAAERAGLLRGASALAGAGGADAALAARVADALAVYGTSEANDEAAAAALDAATAWATHTNGLPDGVATTLAAGLTAKDAGARSRSLRATARLLLASPTSRAGAATLTPALIKAAVDGAAKPASRGDGVAAALAAVLAASAGADAAGLWPTLSQADSPLLSPAGLGRLPTDDAALASSLAGELLARHVPAVGDGAAPARALAALAQHAAASVRAAARTATIAAVASSPDACLDIMQAAWGWLGEAPPPGAADGDGSLSGCARADRVQALLTAAVPRDGAPLPATAAAYILLATHHPALSGPRRRPGAPWRAVARAGVAGPVAAALFASPVAEVSCLMAAATGTDRSARTAAAAALGAAASAAPDAVWPPLEEALETAADAGAHNSLSPDDITIFLTPPGVLALEPTVDVPGGGKGTTAGGPPIRKAAAAPVRAAPAPRASAGRGTGRGSSAAPKKDAAAIWLEQALAGEANIRARVIAVADALEAGLAALAGAARGAPASAAPRLHTLAPLATPLLASPVVGGAARNAVAGLATALPPPARVDAGDLATALAVAARGGDPTCDRAGARAVASLGAAARRGVALPAPAAALASPALAVVLAVSRVDPRAEDALDAVEAMATTATGADAGATSRVLHAALASMPASAPRVKPLLIGLAHRSAGGGVSGMVSGLASTAAAVRAATLASLPAAPDLAPGVSVSSLTSPDVALLYACRHDPNADNAAAGKEAWARVTGAGETPPPASTIDPLIALLATAPSPSTVTDVVTAAAGGLADALAALPDARDGALAALLALGASAPAAAAAALAAAAPSWTLDQATSIVRHLLSGPLADPDDHIRSAWVAAGGAVVRATGAAGAAALLPVVEAGVADAATTCGGDEHAADALRAGGAVLLGGAAANLPPGDARVSAVLDALLDVLRTPSEAVQSAVADSLPGLMPALGGKEHVKALVDTLVERATAPGASYGDRRGAALGAAAALRGAGLAAVTGFGALDAVKSACAAGDPGAREGGLLLFEALCGRFGRLFEPYVVALTPPLLDRFGDASAPVRSAADATARAVTANLTSAGVKLVLPALLGGASARGAWRTQAGAAAMLGAMAHCAPRQLATALPLVVPKLVDALADPHPKVAAAARGALGEVGAVVRNGEVRALAPKLLAALADPAKGGSAALDALLATRFVNTVDAASLALVVPVLARGLRERGGDAKQRAARVAGAMASLVSSPADMAPYVPLLLPEVRACLADPLPAVRAAAAKALGALLRGVGEDALGGVLPWLLDALHGGASSVERAGAAQGLAEVLAVLGPAHVDALLPSILDGCASKAASAREGSLALFTFLPTVMPAVVRHHLDAVLPAVLGGLADEADGVRAAALAAARAAVDAYADDELDALLPAIVAGVRAPAWRVRQSSVELLGDVLFRVTGAGGRARADGHASDDEGAALESHTDALRTALDEARARDTLALLYVARSDVASGVRSASLHVWKSLVANTPRTLADAMPALVAAAVDALASGVDDRSAAGGRCLAELVRKLGDRALMSVLPLLTSALAHDKPPSTRAGAAAGLKEVVDAVPRTTLADHVPGLAAALQAALGASDARVRAAAGDAYGALFRGGGGGGGGAPSLDGVLPGLLAAVAEGGPPADAALAALRVLLGVRPSALGAMLPRLLAPPLTPASAAALASLTAAAGAAVHPHLGVIVGALLTAAADDDDAAASAAADAALDAVATAVADDGGHLLLAALESGLGDETTRAAATRALTRALAAHAGSADAPLADHVPPLLPALVALLASEDAAVLSAAADALKVAAAALAGEAAPSHARALRDAVAAAVADTGGATLPGLAARGSLAPLLPIYLQGVLQGSADLRETAADGLGELLAAAAPAALAPHVVQVAGPLIRVVGDRFPPEVRVAVLRALGVLLATGGVALRPFVPQLQTTFVRGLGDAAPTVRAAAASNLGALTILSSRRDALVTDLAAGAAASPATGGAPPPGAPPTAAGGAVPTLAALTGALSTDTPLADEGVTAAADAAASLLATAGASDEVVGWAAAAYGAAAARTPGPALAARLSAGLLTPAWPPLAAASALGALARRAPAALAASGVTVKVAAAIATLAGATGPGVRAAAARAAGYLAAAQTLGTLDGVLAGGAAKALVALASPDQDGDTQRAALAALRRAAVGAAGAPPDAGPDALTPHLGDIVTVLVALLAAASGPTKLAAERTLARVLRCDAGSDRADSFLASGRAGPMARTYLTDTYVRRLGRLPLEATDFGDFGEP